MTLHYRHRARVNTARVPLWTFVSGNAPTSSSESASSPGPFCSNFTLFCARRFLRSPLTVKVGRSAVSLEFVNPRIWRIISRYPNWPQLVRYLEQLITRHMELSACLSGHSNFNVNCPLSKGWKFFSEQGSALLVGD